MTRDEAVSIMKNLLGFRTDLDTTCVMYLKAVQVELEEAEFLPWFLLTESSNFTTTSGEERVPFPTDFISEHEDTALWYYDAAAEVDSRWTMLKKAAIDTLRGVYQDTVGPPEAYDIDQLYFRIKPTPDGAYVLKLGNYYAKADLLDTNIENVWLKHAPFLLIGKAGQLIATGARDAEAKQEFVNMELRAMVKLVRQDTAREMVNLRPVMGEED